MKNLFLSIFLLFAISAIGQNPDLLVYDTDRPLKWSDFRGPVNISNSHWAETHSGVLLAKKWSRGNGILKIEFTVYARMNRSNSWVVEEKRSNRLLAHEQLHFDIAELNARMLRKALYEAKFTEDFLAESKAIFEQMNEVRNKMQSQYDLECDHGKIEEMQSKWETHIAEQLEKFLDWQKPTVLWGS